MSLSSADITVVIPVYNGARYLPDSVASVRAQSQAVGSILIVDDGSTDDTPAIVETLAGRGGVPIRYVRQDNGGPAAAINRGIALVGSGLVATQCADDLWAPDKIASQMQAISEGAELVFGHLQNFISPELDSATAAGLHCPPDPIPGYSAATMLARVAAFRRVGTLDERFRIGEFIEWYSRAKDLGLATVMLPGVVTMRRLHGSNHSLSRKTEATGYAHVVKAMLDRRRGRQP